MKAGHEIRVCENLRKKCKDVKTQRELWRRCSQEHCVGRAEGGREMRRDFRSGQASCQVSDSGPYRLTDPRSEQHQVGLPEGGQAIETWWGKRGSFLLLLFTTFSKPRSQWITFSRSWNHNLQNPCQLSTFSSAATTSVFSVARSLFRFTTSFRISNGFLIRNMGSARIEELNCNPNLLMEQQIFLPAFLWNS